LLVLLYDEEDINLYSASWRAWLYAIVYSILSINTALNFFRAAFTEPGFIPDKIVGLNIEVENKKLSKLIKKIQREYEQKKLREF
jgi:hypothetical protein